MPNFFYTAKTIKGKIETGVMSAEDVFQVAQVIRNQGLFLIKADPERERRRPKFRKVNVVSLFSGVSLNEKIIMTRNLGTMVSTGLPLVKILGILARQSKNKRLAKALLMIRKKINRGEKLSDAMRMYPYIFNSFFVSMVEVGEESGTLDEVFQTLSHHFSRQYELTSRVRGALVYPILVLLFMCVVAVVMVVFVIPNLNTFFSSLSAELPVYTRLLLSVGNTLSHYWYLLIVGPLSAAVLVFLALRIEATKNLIDTVLLIMPILSPIIKKSNAALLVRSLSSLVSAGVSLTRALEVSSRTVTNHYFVDAMIEANELIKKGEKLSNALKLYEDIFPFGVTEMVEVGEETGKTSEILKKLADFYEQEVINEVEKLTKLIEPALIVVMGIGVAFFAISIIQPMYSTLQVLG